MEVTTTGIITSIQCPASQPSDSIRTDRQNRIRQQTESNKIPVSSSQPSTATKNTERKVTEGHQSINKESNESFINPGE